MDKLHARGGRWALAGAALTAGLCVCLSTIGAAPGGASAPEGPNTPKAQPVAANTPVTIGYSAPIEVFAAPELALLNGEFAKEHLNATVQLVTPSAIPQLLAQGNIQVALSGVSAGILNAINQGVDLTMIGNVETLQPSDPSGLYIPKKFLTSSGMLKKPLPPNFTLTLGNTGLGAVSIYWTENYLKKNGLTINNTTNVNLAQNLIGTALENGSVDAGFANDPYAGPLAKDPNVERVAGAGGAAAYLSTTGYVQQHPAVVEAVLRALVRTTRTYLAPGYRNNAATMSQISKWLNVPTSTIDLSPAPIFLQDMDLNMLKPIVQSVQQTWIAVGKGQILTYSKPIPFSEVSDSKILANVLAGKKPPSS